MTSASALVGRYVLPAPGAAARPRCAHRPSTRTASTPSACPAPTRCRTARAKPSACLARHLSYGHGFPESIALVLWQPDNMKNEGAPIAQALALLGAKPRFDGYGRLAGAELLPLEAPGPAAR